MPNFKPKKNPGNYVKMSAHLLSTTDINIEQKFILALIYSYFIKGKEYVVCMNTLSAYIRRSKATTYRIYGDLFKRGILYDEPAGEDRYSVKMSKEAMEKYFPEGSLKEKHYLNIHYLEDKDLSIFELIFLTYLKRKKGVSTLRIEEYAKNFGVDKQKISRGKTSGVIKTLEKKGKIVIISGSKKGTNVPQTALKIL